MDHDAAVKGGTVIGLKAGERGQRVEPGPVVPAVARMIIVMMATVALMLVVMLAAVALMLIVMMAAVAPILIVMMAAVVTAGIMPFIRPVPGFVALGLRGFGKTRRETHQQGGCENNACGWNPKCTHDWLLVLMDD